MKKKHYKISFTTSFIALIIGASFHNYRMHPQNIEHYNLGVTMGISMITVFGILLILGLVQLIIYKKNGK